jgi:hypothetical protein
MLESFLDSLVSSHMYYSVQVQQQLMQLVVDFSPWRTGFSVIYGKQNGESISFNASVLSW